MSDYEQQRQQQERQTQQAQQQVEQAQQQAEQLRQQAQQQAEQQRQQQEQQSQSETQQETKREARRTTLPRDVSHYLELIIQAGQAYACLPAIWRVRVIGTFTLISQAVTLACFVAWWFMLPQVRMGSSISLLISAAHAAPDGPSGFDPKPIIHLSIFLALFFTFVISVWVSYFGRSAKAADQAGNISKTLLGFFIGAATNYLRV